MKSEKSTPDWAANDLIDWPHGKVFSYRLTAGEEFGDRDPGKDFGLVRDNDSVAHIATD